MYNLWMESNMDYMCERTCLLFTHTKKNQLKVLNRNFIVVHISQSDENIVEYCTQYEDQVYEREKFLN